VQTQHRHDSKGNRIGETVQLFTERLLVICAWESPGKFSIKRVRKRRQGDQQASDFPTPEFLRCYHRSNSAD